MTTDRERVRVVVRSLREASDMNTTHWMRTEAADLIDRLMRENEALRKELQSFNWNSETGHWERP